MTNLGFFPGWEEVRGGQGTEVWVESCNFVLFLGFYPFLTTKINIPVTVEAEAEIFIKDLILLFSLDE